MQILLFPRNVVGARKGGKKEKKEGEKASHVLSGRIRGRVQQPFLSVNSGRAALFVSPSLSLSLVEGESVGPQESRAARRRNTNEITPGGNAIPANVSTWTLPHLLVFPQLFSPNVNRFVDEESLRRGHPRRRDKTFSRSLARSFDDPRVEISIEFFSALSKAREEGGGDRGYL